MRALTEEETRIFFEKLAKYIGKNIVHLIEQNDGQKFCFRLHKERVYFQSNEIAKKATNIGRDNLVSLGVCFGKFTKTKKFRLHVTSLEYLAQYALYKVWLKPQGEMPFLYGNHIIKAHLGRISEDMPEHVGVVVFSMSGIPLGFGVSARSTIDCKKLEPTGIAIFHQADAGEYLRTEETLF